MSLSRRVCAALVAVAALAVVLVTAERASAQESAPVVHFVVDVSGSMSGQPIDEAQEAVKAAVDALPESTALGIRSYSGGCDQTGIAPLVPVGLGNQDEVKAAADGLAAGGGTPTTAALARALDDVRAFDTTGVRRIVLLTDGDTACGISICDWIRQQDLGGIDLSLYAVGLSVSAGAENDLRCAAEFTGGAYISVESPTDLADALTDAAGGNSCPELMLYFARGSGQWEKDGQPIDRTNAGVGSAERNAFFSAVRSRLPRAFDIDEVDAGQNPTPQGVRYDAAGGYRVLLQARASGRVGTFGPYFPSVDAGVDEVITFLNSRALRCPDEQWILGGYSQGAHVLGNALSNTGLSTEAKDNIRFAAFFGDPKLQLRGPLACVGQRLFDATRGRVDVRQFQWVRGSVPCRAVSGSLGPRTPYLPADLSSRVGSWCDGSDIICNQVLNRDTLLGYVTGVHSKYGEDEAIQAASEAAGRLG